MISLTLLLWMTLVLYVFYFAGHVFDLLANIPNWKSGEVHDVTKYRAFYSNSSPKTYFLPLVLGTPLVSLVTLWSVWQLDGSIYLYIGISFIISVIILVLTIKIFVPINEYLFMSPESEYDPEKLKELVSKWISLDYLRLLLLGIGMLTSILALHNYLINL
ncbi:MAG: DUF1772 domain-containing protein [Balneolales bacterium]